MTLDKGKDILLAKMIQHCSHEQWVTVGMTVNNSCELVSELSVAKFSGEIFSHVCLFETFECQLMTKMMKQQVLLKCFEWAIGQDQIGGTKSSDHQELGTLTSPGKR